MRRRPMVAVGITLGTLIGGIGGLLVAPRSGRENREIIRNKAGEVRNRFDQIRDKVRKNRSGSHGELEESLASRDTDYLH